MNKCVIYIDVTSRQETSKSQGLNNRIEILKKFAIQNDYDTDEIFTDYCFEGEGDGRPAFTYMLELIRRGDIKTIVSEKLTKIIDRFCDWPEIYRIFVEHGVRVVTHYN